MAEPTHPTVLRTDSSALTLLPLPKVSDLSAEQLRGACCVWCRTVLTGETARDLGERPHPDSGQIFPRGCTPCVRAKARAVSSLHTRTCRTCIVNREPCLDRRALRDLALEGRRQGTAR
jgi:hypothetical protein